MSSICCASNSNVCPTSGSRRCASTRRAGASPPSPPRGEEAETIETGARAAALGGCTAVICMPNTDPPLDDAAIVQSVLERGRQSACDVHVAGCITKGRKGEQLAPMGELYDLGVRVF